MGLLPFLVFGTYFWRFVVSVVDGPRWHCRLLFGKWTVGVPSGSLAGIGFGAACVGGAQI
jgi:hypothetical protein